MYYLQSRYYDPAICRFINADSYASTGQGIIGHNMYAYCNNNPVRYSDQEGTSLTLAAAIGGAIAGAMINVTSYIVGCCIGGTDITPEGIVQAIVAGMISGVFGAAAGSVSIKATKALYSAYAAFVAAIYAATNGGNWMIAFGATFAGAFVGSLIDTSASYALAEAFANYAVALFTGAPAEMISSGVQTMLNDSQPTSTTQSPTTSFASPATVDLSYQKGASGCGMYTVTHKCYV